MFLSRLILNLHSRQAQSELAQPYEMHRTLMRAFPASPGENAREKHGVLFRTDVDHRHDRVVVYIQSTIEPDWSFLNGLHSYLLPDAESPNPAVKNVSSSYRSIQAGQVLSFRLRANPTKRIANVTKGSSDIKGKRVGLLREEEQIAWLIRKGNEREKGKSGGFTILEQEVSGKQLARVQVRREGKQRGQKRKQGQSHAITHLSVCFDGLLRVSDADAFRETLSRGIGHAKAFGFGLLSIAPVSSSPRKEAR
jgi:CRISPR system Cascade subunit CasE